MRPSSVPCTSSTCSSGQASASTQWKVAPRAASVSGTLRLASSSWIRFMPTMASRVGPSQSAVWRPGWPSSAATLRPESSASAGRPLARVAASAFKVAFSSNVVPVSSGAGRPRSAADTISTPKPRQHGPDLASLATIVGGHNQLGPDEAARHYDLPIARRCRRVSSPMPFLASSSSATNSGSLNGLSSAVPWTSTMPPEPVSTKLASACALESSG